MAKVWTDGACKGNPGPGGWAWVTADGRWAAGYEGRSTNQRMEIMAAYDAVTNLAGPVTVVSDSTYVVNCFRDRWWEGWLRRGWVNSQRKPVANRDLWEPFIELYRSRDDIDFEWVKGHSGDEFNDIADRLAVRAADTQTAASGDVIPDDLGDEDRPAPNSRSGSPGAASATSAAAQNELAGAGGGAGTRDKRLPAGHLIGVFGARPPSLGGYDPNPISDAVLARLRQIIAAKATIEETVHVVSGLRLGAEMLGAEAAVEEGLPLVAVLPFPDPDSPWPAASRRRFAELRDSAVADILLERKVPGTKEKVAGSLRRRDAWLARNIDEAIVVGNGDDPALRKLLKTLGDRLGDDVWQEPIPDR